MYQIRFLPEAAEDLLEISDRRVREKIIARAEQLVTDPELQGKPLHGNFAGLRSVRAVGQRYRIVYEIVNKIVTVVIVGIGIRKEGDKQDVYTKLKKRNRT